MQTIDRSWMWWAMQTIDRSCVFVDPTDPLYFVWTVHWGRCQSEHCGEDVATNRTPTVVGLVGQEAGETFGWH